MLLQCGHVIQIAIDGVGKIGALQPRPYAYANRYDQQDKGCNDRDSLCRMTPSPFNATFKCTGASGRDRLVADEALQVLR